MAACGTRYPHMEWKGDLALNFRKFKAMCQLHFSGPLKSKQESEKVSYFLIWTGDEGVELVSTWDIPDDKKNKLSYYYEQFEKYVQPKSNFRLARYQLRTLKQESGETVDTFIKRIKVVINQCQYNQAHIDDFIIDTLIFGTNSENIKTKLLEHSELTLDKAVDIARTQETTSAQIRDMGSSSTEVHAVKTYRGARPKQKRMIDCKNCGRTHEIKKCPAYGTTCKQCGKKNHWKLMCHPKSKPHSPAPRQKAAHSAEFADASDERETLYFNSLTIDAIVKDETEAYANVEVELGPKKSKTLSCKLDSGAEGNIIPLAVFNTLEPKPLLTKSHTVIKAYGGHKIPQVGKCVLVIRNKQFAFYVVDVNGPTILGFPTSRDLGFITINVNACTSKPTSIVDEFKDCFQGIGCFTGEYSIELDPTVTPVVHPPRRVPEALKDSLKKELDSLCDQQIMAKVDKPTEWVNSLVCVTKANGSLRVCLDPKDLNHAIKRPHHYTPTMEDVLPKLSGAKYFSIVDARSGYWNIKLDEKSSYYTTFNTCFGRYRFLRLPFGLICSQDVFQRKVDETFGDLPGVTGIADDIIVYGTKEDGSDHDENLRRLMERARQTGIRFNQEKCRIRQTSIPFFGHIIAQDGIHPDPKKVEAINAMDPSHSLSDLQTFLGMVQFLGRFIPNIATHASVLWDLTKKDSEFVWSPEHQSAVDRIKSLISEPKSLQYFDSTKPVVVQVDASSRGIGAALLQDKGPIEYRSKLLTETESRYSNIEREMLAVVFGLEKFKFYTYGRHVTVHSDHKPLEAIWKKNICKAPPRLARMMLKIQGYDISIQYVPGKDVPLADALSRLNPLPDGTIGGIDITVHDVHLNASPSRLSDIRRETESDAQLTVLKEIIHNGWPDSRASTPDYLHPYWNYRDELMTLDGVILKGDRIVIPSSLRKAALQQLHFAHQGMEKCKLRAKGCVFWPGINGDIEAMVNDCNSCQQHQPQNTKEPLLSHEVPPRAWHTIASDLFLWDNKHYLLVCDYFSKFPIIRKLSDIRSETVIQHLKGIFEENGVPEKFMSDNGTQYSSELFKSFSNTWGFTHITSSPHYPRSNGLAERCVRTVKTLLQKCKETGADPHLAMLVLRSTPIDHHLASPAELLNSRAFKSNLPIKPTAKNTDDIVTRLQHRQDNQKRQHDKLCKPLDPLSASQPVRVKDHNSSLWKPAIVQQATEAPRSYVVQSENNSVLRRNRSDIRTCEPPRRSGRTHKPPQRYGYED